MKKDIELCYYGGTGGFFAFWIILLASNYRCKWSDRFDHLTLDDAFYHQWNIDTNQWKKTEIWPNNKKTKSSEIQQKIYLVCNPTSDDIKNNNKETIRIVLYTDLKTHFELIKFKKCFIWFEQKNLKKFKLDAILKLYQNFKGIDWVNVKKFDDFLKLTPSQLNELDKVFNFRILNSIDDTYEENFSFKFNDDSIWLEYKSLIESADIVVKWQDIIKTNGEILLSPLGLSTNQRVKDFVTHYINQHNNKIKKIIFNNIDDK